MTQIHVQPPTPQTLRVTQIGEYIRHHSCERRFKLELNDRAEAKNVPFASRFFNSIDPVLQAAGREREDTWAADLTAQGLAPIVANIADPDEKMGLADFLARLQSLATQSPLFAREVEVTGLIGHFNLTGRVDFLVLLWRNGKPILRIVECKASRRDRTYHRLQVALYRRLISSYLDNNVVTILGQILTSASLEAVVARIEEETNLSQQILAIPALDLSMEDADLERLLANGGPLERVAVTPVEDLPFRLETKCDGCVFSVHCLTESARQRRLELLGLSPSSVAALRRSGISDLDQLAELDSTNSQATQIRQDLDFEANIDHSISEAKARRRTLPGGVNNQDEYEVQLLQGAYNSQLPEQSVNGEQIVRVYLCVDHDYTENRVGALSAHITKSSALLHSGWRQNGLKADGSPKLERDPVLRERIPQQGVPRANWAAQTVQGKDIEEMLTNPWSGDFASDTGMEKQMIQSFLRRLVDELAEVAATPQVRIHFYVWSRIEIRRLVEACARADTRLLSSLRQLLGCRESLEEMIFSSVQDEVDRRYALGWTGRGLSVVSSLRWFGESYHWRRMVAGVEVDLDSVFEQDIFDFKTNLHLLPNGVWDATDPQRANPANRYKFEIRARFNDSLTAPYWRALWDALPDPASVSDPNVASAIRRYLKARPPGMLRSYLRERCHALRWVEERVSHKSQEIADSKQVRAIADLPRFDLNVNNTAQAAIDFLRLDHHVKMTEWKAQHLAPVSARVRTGRTLRLRDLRMGAEPQLLEGTIDLAGLNLTLADMESRSSLGVGGFVRVSPTSDDPHRGQTVRQLVVAGCTATIHSIDYSSGLVELSVVPNPHTNYVVGGYGVPDTGFDFATIDESPSDFVAGRVDNRLRLHGAISPICSWLDLTNPQIPPQSPLNPATRSQIDSILDDVVFRGHNLAPDQKQAVLEGLDTRIQLLQGPPGTGKTQTTSLSLLSRILARHSAGDVVLIAANTHTAVDELLKRVAEVLPEFRSKATVHGASLPTIQLVKVHSSSVDNPSCTGIEDKTVETVGTLVNRAANDVCVLGATTSALLKMVEKQQQKVERKTQQGRTVTARERKWLNFTTPLLIVDEASMMVFPHFLSLATLVGTNGEIMLAGDHRQLSPIVAHNWEDEDRPPTTKYQPFVSAYEALQRISIDPQTVSASAHRSALSHTFRLPPLVRNLVARLYQRDDIALTGPVRGAGHLGHGTLWDSVWEGQTGLFLVLHEERQSRQSNATEVEIVRSILDAQPQPAMDNSVAVVTPHRAQRVLLNRDIQPNFPSVGVVDTVERLQGGERDTIIVSATASEPSAIDANVSFILNLNRSNVAFSRAKDRLVVVCSESLMGHIPVEVEDYEAAMLWKSLRSLCSEFVGEEQIGGHTVRVFAPDPLLIAQLSGVEP